MIRDDVTLRMASKRKLDDGYSLAVQTLHLAAPRFTGRSTVIVARKWHPGWPGNKGKLDCPREFIVSKQASVAAVKVLLATEYLVATGDAGGASGSSGGEAGGGGDGAGGSSGGDGDGSGGGRGAEGAGSHADASVEASAAAPSTTDPILVAKWSRFINPGKPLSGVNAKTLKWDVANNLPAPPGADSPSTGSSAAAADAPDGAVKAAMQLCGREFGYRDDCVLVHCSSSSFTTAKQEIGAARARKMKALDDAVTASTAAVAHCREAFLAAAGAGGGGGAPDAVGGGACEATASEEKPAPADADTDAAATAAATATTATTLCDEICAAPQRYLNDGQ